MKKDRIQRFTEKVEYKEASSLKDQGELATMLLDIQSFLENRVLKDYAKSDVNQDVVEKIIKNIEESTELVKTIFK